MRLIDITGQKYGRLTAIKRVANNKHNQVRWLFKCDCGKDHIADVAPVRRGKIASCGCLRDESTTSRSTSHGASGTRLFHAYNNMKQRCYNEKSDQYKHYGGRGITVCNEWLSDPQVFFDWAMANGYTDKLTLDRKDNNKGYSPDNCRWVSQAVQNRNTRQNVSITIGNKTKVLADWAVEFNVSATMIARRIKRGWNAYDAITTPSGGKP